MKVNISNKDRQTISVAIKYFACALAVIFLIRGIVKRITPKESVVQDETVSVVKEDLPVADGSWVDSVIESEEVPQKIPQATMSSVVDYSKLDERRKTFIDCAKKFLGVPYKYGGADYEGMDCSGFIFEVAREVGINLPKSAKGMFASSSILPVKKEEMLPGDLLFFIRDGDIYHVAIYLGDNMVIHSVSDGSETGVLISALDGYWAEHYYSSGNIFVD